MKCDWRNEVRVECFTRADLVPPTMFGEAAWDALLALYADEHNELTLDGLSGLVGVPAPSLQKSLVGLERQRLVRGELDHDSGKIRAVLTPGGQHLL
ncbi:hypothetical protein OVY48_06260 [Sphingobium sp. SA2]|uniref:hypothetical protein n=1 Tax=Sphingobium sp. SA2 TaxID=1524832 RepID=UPI0028BFD70B|nr:hypothetical protein [Sphingobium sp. SA2]MDT7533040.1 hypothetical protein [Sphingobium sp. SA2]